MRTHKKVLIISSLIMLVGVFFTLANVFKKKKMSNILNDNDLEPVLSQIFINEGCYINDPSDSGGETNFGISKKYHPFEDIKNMTKERATEIYIDEYILPIYEKIKSYPVNYKYQAIDTAINCGVSRAKKFIDLSLGNIEEIKKLRTDFYKSIAIGEKAKFLNGWLKRVNTIIYK